MNVFHKVTIESMKKNRVRTLVTIIGIMLSTALICAVATSIYSALCFSKEMVIYEEGDWHGLVCPLTEDRVEELRGYDEVDEVFSLGPVAYKPVKTKAAVGTKVQMGLSVFSADEGCFENLPFHLKSGRYPENDSEIILPDSIFDTSFDDFWDVTGIDFSIGSELEFSLNLNSEDLDPEKSDIENLDSILSGESKKYTIVGIYKESHVNHLIEDFGNILCLTKNEGNAPVGSFAFFKLKKPGNTSDFLNQKFNFNESRNAGISNEVNHELLMFNISSGDGGFIMAVFFIAAIIFGLIVFGSVALIYNSFAISVSERTKQFGLLSSIGATKKQINRMIEYEALLLSLIGIPLGILLGLGGIGTTFKLLGSRFESITGMLEDSPVKLELHLSWAAILFSILLAEFTVRLSAWIPSVRAQRISAVEAIRQSGDIKAKNKRIRTPKLIYKVFGLPGMLAQKYFKRSKKRYRATVISLFMSIVLFVTASAFTSYLVKQMEEEFATKSYDIIYTPDIHDEEKAQKLFEKLKNADDVKKAACSEVSDVNMKIDTDMVSSEVKDIESRYQSSRDDLGEPAEIFFVDDDIYREYLDDNGLDEDKYMDPDHPIAIVYDVKELYDIVKAKTFRLHFFDDDVDTIRISQPYVPEGYVFERFHDDKDEQGIMYKKMSSNKSDDPEELYLSAEETSFEYDVEIGKRIDKAPFFASPKYSNDITFIYPVSLKDSVLPKRSEDSTYSYAFLSDSHKDTTKSIREILGECGEGDEELYDYAAEVESIRNMVVVVKVFASGFIVIISLIAAANVFNTISTNISLRRREFAMLRSIGMGQKGLNRMMNYECLLYGIKSLILGLPLSFVLSYLIFRAFDLNYQTSFIIPWKSAIIASASVFIVVFSTMIYSMSKIKKDNTIDALKNENI